MGRERNAGAGGLALALAALAAVAAGAPARAEQVAVPRIQQMPNLPRPFAMKDWRATAVAFDRLAFDPDAKGEYLPLLWWDDGRANYDFRTFGLPSYVGAPRKHEGQHEGITCIAAVLGATLAGIDKSKGGPDWVLMCQQYFNRKNGQNLVLNHTSGGTGGSFWYEIWPSVLFFGLVDRYPATGEFPRILRTTADRWCDAVAAMTGPDGAADFNHTAFNFAAMKPVDNGRWTEPDAAAGIAWIQCAAYAKWKEPKHLRAADACLAFLARRDKAKGNPYYEVLLPWGALAAARMNAECGRSCDVAKLVDWCFDAVGSPRGTWGATAERWGEFDCHGLIGSVTDGGGYAFAMNTFAQAGALVPMVRYDDRFARAIGKWMLNAANAARLFYPGALPDDHQSCPGWKGDPARAVAYEGLRKAWQGKSPYSTGDPVRLQWGPPTDLGLYGSAHVGFFGGIIARTGQEAVLRLDCLATDFFHAPAYPTYLYYNPYPDARKVKLGVGPAARDLYDAAADAFLARGVQGEADVEIPPDAARLVVVVPAGGKVTRDGPRMLVDGVVADWHAAEPAHAKP